MKDPKRKRNCSFETGESCIELNSLSRIQECVTQSKACQKNRIQIAALNWRNRRNNLFLDYSGFLCTQNMPVESNNEKLIAVIGDEVGSEWVAIME